MILNGAEGVGTNSVHRTFARLHSGGGESDQGVLKIRGAWTGSSASARFARRARPTPFRA